ncbi:pyridoxal phosphate-dependent transferase [Gongronella butleri]|nr:pyridoxal phosphate-dependent transferase [Gongronella butleri]
MDYAKYLTDESKNRQASATRALLPFVSLPGMLSLGAGLPNPETFPYESMQLKLKTGEIIEVSGDNFNKCLNYDLTSGFAPLNKWIRGLQEQEHKPPVDFVVSVGVGSQDLISKALQMVINPGTPILVENPTYTGVLSFLKSQPCELIGMATDGSGLIPEKLEHQLVTWPADRARPQVMYTIPVGGNPTGASVTLERKKQIYAICQKYDILIYEDDPYRFLEFKTDRTPSYLSMDVDGRVLRFDSLSKILSAGMRLGFVTGPKALVERIDLHTMATNLQPSGVAQLMAYELLNHWGYDGFYAHVKKTAAFYEDKAKVCLALLKKHLTGLAEWSEPDSGMFVWLRLLGGITDTQKLIVEKAVANKVLAMPGEAFLPTTGEPSPNIRLSYSNISAENMDEALRRLAEVIKQEIQG